MSDMETGYHYQVMRRAIDLIDQAEQPMTLEALAAEMQMSPAHFQRLFFPMGWRLTQAVSAIPVAGACKIRIARPLHDVAGR